MANKPYALSQARVAKSPYALTHIPMFCYIV